MVSPGHVCQHRMKVNWPTVDKNWQVLLTKATRAAETWTAESMLSLTSRSRQQGWICGSKKICIHKNSISTDSGFSSWIILLESVSTRSITVLSTMSASAKSIHVWGEKLPKTSSLSSLVIYGQKHYPPLLNWSWDFLKSRLCSSKGKPGWNYRQRWNSTVSAISDAHSSVRLKKKSEHLDGKRISFIKESVS